MDRPRANFSLSSGVRLPVTRPTRHGSTRVDYEVTLAELKTWLDVSENVDAAQLDDAITEAIAGPIQDAIDEAVAASLGTTEVYQWDDFTSETGTSYTLTESPTAAARADVFLDGVRLQAVGSAPTATQCRFSGADLKTLTIGVSKTAGQTLVARYPYAAVTPELVVWICDDLTGTASDSFTLTQTPATEAEVDVYLTGIRLHYTAGTPAGTEFALSGTSGTLGLTRKTTDTLVARYIKA